MNEFYKIIPPSPLSDELVELSFVFSVESMPAEDTEDASFPYPDEIFSVNFGESGKFPSDLVYQSRFLVLRCGDKLNLNGYAPDFARKSNIIKDKSGSALFLTKKEYSVKLSLTKYRVYVDVDNGLAKTSYGNGRDEITDVAFYVRKGVKVNLRDCRLSGGPMPEIPVDSGLKALIDGGIVCNYLSYHVGPDGVYFDRISIPQNLKCTTRNSGAYQSNVCIDAYTDAREIYLEYEVTDIPTDEWPTQFGFLVNGRRVEMPVRVTERDKVYGETFVIPEGAPECNRITVFFPFSVSMAVRAVRYGEGVRFVAPEKRLAANFYGDSITEGSECFDAAAAYVSQVCVAYNLHGLNQAISGRTFNDYNVLGDYPRTPDYVFIANGTNDFAGGTGDRDKIFDAMEQNMITVISAAKQRFPMAKLIALLPIWRSDEAGERFSLAETVERIREVYARYPEITVIDCHSFVPADASYFSSTELALHPNSRGHDEYARNLLKALEDVLGKPPVRDEARLADLALNG